MAIIYTMYRNYGLDDTYIGPRSGPLPQITDVDQTSPGQVDWSRDNYDFLGWNTSSNASGTMYQPGDTPSNSQVFAIWKNAAVVPDITISYNGDAIASLSDSGTEVLETNGKLCEDDIIIDYTKPTPYLQFKVVNPVVHEQTISPDNGYDGLLRVTVHAISPMKTAQTYTPTTTDQTIASGRWLDGNQTIKGDANLVAANIKKDVQIFGVTGSYEGGGGSDTVVDFIENHDTFASFEHSSVTKIGQGTFAYCSDLQTVSFPACTSIGSSAFYYCTSLSTVSFPACTNICSNAFINCVNLTTASFPACTNIGDYAFISCYSLTTVSFPDCTNIGSYAFYSCSSLQTASFPACTSIGSSAFYYCTSLSTISFPTCRTIGSYAFNSCVNLTIASFPACTSIDAFAFNRCFNLTTASFPACTSISSYAFASCSSLTTVSFPSCTSMGNYAFYLCVSLKTVSFPACTNIGSSAFYSCSSLQTVSFPACMSIRSYAFAFCSSITTVSFPACTSISGYVFNNCVNLTTASFPTCRTIGSYAFNSCRKLLSLYLTGSRVVSLHNSNAFISTPIAGYTASTGGVYGSIFVPSSLYSTYITSTNWTYFSSRFASV